jgi:hypothetical protein
MILTGVGTLLEVVLDRGYATTRKGAMALRSVKGGGRFNVDHRYARASCFFNLSRCASNSSRVAIPRKYQQIIS